MPLCIRAQHRSYLEVMGFERPDAMQARQIHQQCAYKLRSGHVAEVSHHGPVCPCTPSAGTAPELPRSANALEPCSLMLLLLYLRKVRLRLIKVVQKRAGAQMQADVPRTVDAFWPSEQPPRPSEGHSHTITMTKLCSLCLLYQTTC